MVEGIVAIIIIYGLWKLFIDGLLWKIILFPCGWFGLYILLRVHVPGAKDTAMTLGQSFTISWSALIPTILCLLVLACSKSE